MKVWITKFALTSGIYAVEADISVSPGYVSTRTCPNGTRGYTQLFSKKYWCETKEEALAVAEEMRIKKLQSLNKQIKKLSVKEIKINDYTEEDK